MGVPAALVWRHEVRVVLQWRLFFSFLFFSFLFFAPHQQQQNEQKKKGTCRSRKKRDRRRSKVSFHSLLPFFFYILCFGFCFASAVLCPFVLSFFLSFPFFFSFFFQWNPRRWLRSITTPVTSAEHQQLWIVPFFFLFFLLFEPFRFYFGLVLSGPFSFIWPAPSLDELGFVFCLFVFLLIRK